MADEAELGLRLGDEVIRLENGEIGALIRFHDEPAPAAAPSADPLVEEARSIMREVVETRPHPEARLLNRLATILEEEEARYQEKARYPCNKDYRSSHTIGQLLSLVRDDDDFYEVLCCEEFLQGPKNMVAAGFRVILLSITTWGYTFSFRDPILEMVKRVVLEELDKVTLHRPSSSGFNATEALTTYAIGLFACQLSGGDVASESLSSGQPTQFMRYVRHWTFGEAGKPDPGDSKAIVHKVEGRGKKVAIDGDKLLEDGRPEVEAMETDEKRAKVKSKSGHSREDEARGKTRAKGGGKDRIKPKAEQSFNSEEKHIVGNVDITVFARRAMLAAQTEARRADAPPEAVKAAGDAAADLVKAAALEALEETQSEEAALTAAENAAASVADAAESVVRKQEEEIEAAKQKNEQVEEPYVDPYVMSPEELAFLRALYCVQCLEKLGEYIDILGPVLQERGVEVCVTLLRRHSANAESVRDMAMVSEVLRLVCALASHRKFAALFVDLGGMQQLLLTPRIPQTLVGISLCLLAVASLPGIFERVCALPSSPAVVHECVELALFLLDCCQDTARKNAAVFMNAAFMFRDVLDAFETQDGLSKFLAILRNIVNLRFGNVPASEVLTVADKHVAFHLSVALKEFFRATFLALMDSLRPCRNHRGASRLASTSKASCKPVDVSNEAIETVIQQMSRDRKLGTAFLRAKWPAMDKFLSHGGHILLVELSQVAAPGEKYMNDIVLHALPVLQLVTLIPSARRTVVSATLTNGRPGMGVFLDSLTNGDPEVVQQALLVLINLVCPPPAFSSRSSSSSTTSNTSAATPSVEKQVKGDEASTSGGNALVGDSRITLGPASGGPGLAAYMEQGYRQAREAVRSNNGIKSVLNLLHQKTPPSQDSVRALACRVLLGLARDDTIAQILTKLQVGKLLSELLRDGSHRQSGVDMDKWQTELNQAALDLIGVVTNAGKASTVASEAAAPTLRRIERAAIAAATPITYHPRELLQLIHEHLVASGLASTASTLLKEAHLTPLDSLLPVASLSHTSNENLAEKKAAEKQWPAGRISSGILFGSPDDDRLLEFSGKKKLSSKSLTTPKRILAGVQETPVPGAPTLDENSMKTPGVSRVLKRKAGDKEAPAVASPPSIKRPHISAQLPVTSPLATPQPRLRCSNLPHENGGASTPAPQPDAGGIKPWMAQSVEKMEEAPERSTLDSVVGQYLKHQHRQCPAPITTLPPLSLLHPHVCPDPSPALYAPYNISARLEAREINPRYGGLHGSRHNRHFIYSRFRHVRSCRDDRSLLLTCATYVGSSGHLAAGCHQGGIRIFDPLTTEIIETYEACHSPWVTSLQAAPHNLSGVLGGGQLLLSCGGSEAKLWNSGSLASGPFCTFGNCRGATFNRAGTNVGALRPDSPKEVLLFDVNSCSLKQTLSDASLQSSANNTRHSGGSIVHFSPSDDLVLWRGILWDHRVPRSVHRFDQFSDYGGGGFHPAGNEVIINSEVWDLRTFKLLRSVTSLDQTVLSFNTTGDVIYAVLRRPDDVAMALHSKRTRHPLFAGFRTMDSVDYTDISTTQVDRCVLDLTTHYNESQIALVVMDTSETMESTVKFYDVGRRKPTDDDSDPDDGMDSDEEEEDESDGEDDDPGVRLLRSSSESLDLDDEGDDSSESDEDDGVGLSDAETEDLEMFHYLGDGVDGVEIDEEDGDEEGGGIDFYEEEDGDDGMNGILHGFLH